MSWLDELKPGDSVIVRRGRCVPDVAIVATATKTTLTEVGRG
jgi:hypothetical protein